MSLLKLWLTAIAVSVCLMAGCGGGFGADGGEAEALGPGVFGPDSSNR